MRSSGFDSGAFDRAFAKAADARKSARVSPARWAWREAAAVRSDFPDFGALRTGAPEADANPEVVLQEDCRLVRNVHGEPRWRLDEGVRRMALQRLGSAEAILELIPLNPAPGDTFQRHLEAMARGARIDLGALPFPELVEVHQLTEWLADILPGVPDLAAVEHQLELADLLSPFRGLTGDGFHGRYETLERLRRHVHGKPSAEGGGLGQLLSLTRPRRDRNARPLMIQGIGGSGKSTVIARFLLDMLGEPDPLVFAYIDFDRPGLRAREPLTLLAEIAHQVGIQQPELAAATGFVRDAALNRVAQRGPEGVVVAQDVRRHLLARFGRAVAGTIGDTRPLVLVLDTLEEVQYRGQDFIDQLWLFIDELNDAVGGLRVIAAGRIPLQDVPAKPLPLDDLDEDSARAFLRERLRLAGVDPAPIVESIVKQVGRNPLSLRLAADVVPEIGPKGLKDAVREGRTGEEIDAELVQGVLYQRILQHVHHDVLEKLALPGLALRRITPAVIRDVLAVPCNVSLPDDEDAESLLAAFAGEVALVETDPDGSLRYRSDVRRLALRFLPKDPSVPIAAINARAVEFYKRREGAAARAEELYHRLRQGDAREELERLWDPALTDLLGDALDDLQGREYAWLATKLGLPLRPEGVAMAEQPEWEAYAAKSARNQLDLGNPSGALDVLRERKSRQPASRLPLLEAEALTQLGDSKGAAKVLDAGLATAQGVDARLVVELNLASARVLRRLQKLQPATKRLQAAAESAAALHDPFVELEVLVTTEELELPSAVAGLQVDDILARTGLPKLARRPELLAATAGAFGEQRPPVLLEALHTLGLPARRPKDIAVLADALGALTQEPASGWEPKLWEAAGNPALAHDLLGGLLAPPVSGRLAGLYRDLGAGEGPAHWRGRELAADSAWRISPRTGAPDRRSRARAAAITPQERRLSAALRIAAFGGLGLAGYALAEGIAGSGSHALATVSCAFGVLLAVLATVAAGDVRRYGWSALVLAFGFGCVVVALTVYATLAALVAAAISVALIVAWSAAVRARYGLRFLGPVAFHTLVGLAEVLTGHEEDGLPPEEVAQRVDGYLAAASGRADRDALSVEHRAARHKGPAPGLLRSLLVSVGLAPLMWLRPPLAAMAPPVRLHYLERHLIGEAVSRRRHPFGKYMQELIRAGCQLVYLGYYGDARSWPAIGYVPYSRRQGVDLPRPTDFGRPALRSLTAPPRRVRYDAVVIGSGAGGALAAYRLAESGRRVLVVERGPHVDPREFSEDEAEQYLKLYDGGGLRKITDWRLQVLAGACVGGSTTIGNAVCVRPPEAIIEGWADRGIEPAEVLSAIDEVAAWLPVQHVDGKEAGGGGMAFANGVRQLALPGRLELTWSSLRACLGCGYCNLGCAFGRKLSMLDTVLAWAQEAFPDRVYVLPSFEARRIEHADGRATAVSGDHFGEKLSVEAAEVVVAAGAVASSWLLRRSRIGNKRPGAELYFNLGVPLVADFPDRMQSFAGLQTSHTYIPDHNGVPPFVLETFFHQPLAQALSMPGWFDQHYENMRRYDHMAGGIVQASASTPARLTPALLGGAGVMWSPSVEDRVRLVDGLMLLGRIFLAAGALRVMPASFSYHECSSPTALDSLKDYLLNPASPLPMTGTPQGGNPVGEPAQGGVVDSDFRVHGFRNLYVCDASVFPTTVGVPPLMTVMGMAQYAARRIAAAGAEAGGLGPKARG